MIQGDDGALGQKACIDAQRAGPKQAQNGKINDDKGNRVHQGGNPTDAALISGQRRILFPEARLLRRFAPEGAQNADAVQILPRRTEDRIQLLLDPAVKRDADQHNAEHHERKGRDHGKEPERRLRVDRERHQHRAEDDEGRAQKQAQGQIQTGLDLVHIGGHAGDQRGDADCVQGPV